MAKQEPGIPGVFLALDMFGALLVAIGILAATGQDFGIRMLRTAAPGLVAIGVVLWVPMVLWAVKRRRER